MEKLIFILIILHAHIMNLNAQGKVSDFKQIDKGIYCFWFNQYENKTILAEFNKFLVVIEFPQNDTLANAIIKEAKDLFPKKPIMYVLHTHHHQHSISSFDPFIKLTPAKLVTTKYNFQEVKKQTTDTVSLKARFVHFDSLYIIQDKSNKIEYYEILQTKYSVPTPEYNVVYFPGQKILVSGCLFNKPLSYYEIINTRKTALKNFITNNKIIVNNFIPTNSCKASGFEDICSSEMFDSSFVYGINPNVFADNIQSKSIEYLDSRQDSLVAEFKKIPRSYDYMVCGNTLKSLRKDYYRAIIVFKSIAKIYPKEIDPYLFIAECYELKGDKIEAIAYYQKYLSLATNSKDIAEIKLKIEELKK